MIRWRKILQISLLCILIGALYTAIVTTAAVQADNQQKATLDNVRDYTLAWPLPGEAVAPSYAIDSGYLYVGGAEQWEAVSIPSDVVAGAVAVDPYHPATLYLGAANEMALYLSRNQGRSWERIGIDDKYLGGVTDIAINGAQRTLYVGTDNSGIYRLRDVGSSLILSGHTPFAEPIIEVVSDQFGAGLIFARTEWTVYRGMNNGQQWLPLDGLATTPTALAVTNGHPATAYIGTTDRGLLQSTDGVTWQLLDEGLFGEAGNRLHVDALAVDPAQPELLYVARSYLFGHTAIHQRPLGVTMSTDGGQSWATLPTTDALAVTELLPVSGLPGAVFALTPHSRTPVALGETSTLVAATIDRVPVQPVSVQPQWMISFVAWLVAAAAAAALALLMLQEWQRQPALATVRIG